MPDLPRVLRALEKVPSETHPHIWADYIELLCLVNVSRQLSRADLLDRISERKDLGEGSEISDDRLMAPEESDRMTQKAEDWFRHLEYRQGAFESFYPFTVSEDGRTLSRQDMLSENHKLYVFFLLSSNLRYFQPQQTALTRDFELVSREALRACLPAKAEVHIFGTSSAGMGRYNQSTLWDRIRKLADDTHAIVTTDEARFPQSFGGDRGLDIVAWIPMGDSVESTLLVVGQCACTLEWVQKQHSSSENAWWNVLRFPNTPSNVSFIPFCLREPNGNWYRPSDRANIILIDRLRFAYLLNAGFSEFEGLESRSVVDQLLAQEAPLF